MHTRAGGSKVRIRLANLYGDVPLAIGSARIARRSADANIDPASDRALTFGGQKSATVAAHASVTTDAMDLDVPPLSDLAVSLFFPDVALAATSHSLAKQTDTLRL